MKGKKMQNLLNKGSTARKFFSTLVMTSLVVPGILLQVPEAKALGTLATTVISNQATAKYKDAGGNSYTSTSNLVTTTISQVYGVSLIPSSTDLTSDVNAQANTDPSLRQNATAGTIVYYPYTLTNTGNAPETYFITSSVGSGTTGGSGGTLGTAVSGSRKVFLDVNGNGTIDVGDVQIADGGVTPNVPADGTIKLIVQYQIPVTATTGDSVLVDIQADSEHDGIAPIGAAAVPTSGFDKWNYNKTTIVNNGVVSVVKAVDKATSDPSAAAIVGPPAVPAVNNDLTYSFNIGNTGNKSADNIVVIDAIPTNTAFIVGSQIAASGTFTYYTSTDGSGAAATPVADANGLDLTIKSIKYTLGDNVPNNGNELPPANNRTISFKVRVNVGAPSTAIPNFASFTYEPDTLSTTITSPLNTNTVNTNINKKAGALVSFAATGRFSAQTAVGTDPAGTDESVQTSAPAGTYVYYKNVVTNNGNAADTFNITAPGNTFPAGSTVTFLALTDPTTPTNNTSPILDTNSDGIVDTGNIAAGGSLTIVTRVFVPANSTNVGAPFTVTVNAASTNGGTAFSATPGQSLSDTTKDTLSAVVQPSVKLLNIINGTPVDNTNTPPLLGQTFTEVAPGATVSYPLNVNNGGSTSDTFNLSGSVGIAGSTVTFYPINVATTVGTAAIAGATSVTLTSGTGINAGDKIVINGQTLTVGTIVGALVTFSSGQSLAAAAGAGTTAVVPGTSAITSTNLIAPIASAPNNTQNVLAVVSVPATALPNGAGLAISFTATSTNNSGKADSEPDQLVIPSFRNYTLVNNRAGSAPAGGVLFYDHTITNDGNVNETYTITIPADAPGGMSYQLIDKDGIPSGLSLTTITITPGGTYNFKLKVTVPAGLPATTVDSKVIKVHETSSPITTDQTNTDSTTVVSGFISLVKSVAVFPVGTGATGGTANGSNTSAKPGEVLEYTITYTNIGTQSALESAITDAVPANTTYIPGSLFIGSTGANDARDAVDNADFGFTSTNAATFNIGTGATNLLGGTVPQGGTGFVKFRVKIN